ncbi:MAG: hypothetical protein PUF61_08325 [Spirochaetales bacterium]|nr:hypothetical protein [Spirochaetales bacterium]
MIDKCGRVRSSFVPPRRHCTRTRAKLRAEGISKIFCLVFKDNEIANSFWQKQGYTLRTDLNYRNKSLNPAIPQGK